MPSNGQAPAFPGRIILQIHTRDRTWVKNELNPPILRTDILADIQGQRLGYKTTYFEHTLGVAHYFSDWLVFRPEVRLDYTSGAKAIDNGTKREMFTFSADLIIRF